MLTSRAPASSGGASPEPDVVDPRHPAPFRRLDLLVAGGTTLFAATVYLVALALGATPPETASVTMLAAAPAFALVALVALELRLRAAPDAWLGWFSAGLAAALVAMTLQLISFPLVDPSGGPLGTGADAVAALYLVFHLCLASGAGLALLNPPARFRWLLTAAGVAAGLLVATEALPVPRLLTASARFTGPLRGAEWVLAALVLAVVTAWTWRGGRDAPALRGWVSVALLVSAYDLVLNALGAERYSAVWWGSLSLRVLTYAVLALGVVSTIVLQLRDVDRYSQRELERREGQLRHALQSASALMVSAERFSRATTPTEVAQTLCEQAALLGGLPHAELLEWQDVDEPSIAARHGDPDTDTLAAGWRRDATLAMSRLYATGEGVFLESPAAIAEWTAGRPGPGPEVGALVLVPLASPQAPPALLVTWGPHPVPMPVWQRRLVAGLVNQAGQAWGRAAAYDTQARAAATLQSSLLPTGLAAPEGLTLAARYVPGESGLRVGGDWFDCLPLSDDLVALVVGDVMGKGLHAAAVMGQVRTTTRTLARLDPTPHRVIAGLDQLTHELDVDEIATVTYALLNRSTGTLGIARAGHVPPLLVPRRGRARFVVPGGSPPLGAPSEGRRHAELQLRPGDVLVLYTDGLVEDRVSGLDIGMHQLQSTAESMHDRFAVDLEGCADRLLAWSGSPHRDDDVALMVVRLDGREVAASSSPDDLGSEALPA